MEFLIGRNNLDKVCNLLCEYNIPWTRIRTDGVLIIEDADLVRIQKEIPLNFRLSLPHQVFVACHQAKEN